MFTYYKQICKVYLFFCVSMWVTGKFLGFQSNYLLDDNDVSAGIAGRTQEN